jgi:streptogramin lyase
MNPTTHCTPSTPPHRLVTAALAFASVAFAGLLSGCATGGSGVESSTVTPAKTVVEGRILGGQQAVSGATLQLYAVGSSVGGVATPLISSTVTSDAGGNFSITGTYTCPTNAYVYLTATGGNPGLTGPGINNTSLGLMAALGRCDILKATLPFTLVNEVTTVASVYALAPFMADYQHIGAPSSNLTGLQNAFGNVNSLVTMATGTSPGAALPATSSVPSAELNTLANILSVCINTDGTGSGCGSLFAAAKSRTGVTPTNTIDAMFNIVANPAANVSTLFGMAPTSPPFQPKLATAPNDWTVAITASGSGLNAPVGIAIDAAGAAWIANSAGTSITNLSAQQTPISGTAGFTNGNLLGPQGIAIDTIGNAWIANSYGSSVVELSPTGNLLSPTGGYTLGGITSPFAIAIDPSNNIWVANYGNGTVSGLSTSGSVAAIAGSPFNAGGSLVMPSGIAIDSASNVWISSTGSNSVSKIGNDGTNLSGVTGFSDGILQAPYGIAIDGNTHAYIAGNGFNEVSILNSAGANVPNGPISGSAISAPAGVAVDGANVVFITNSQTAGSLSMLTSATAMPIKLGTLNMPVGVAVDSAGSVWTTNSGDNTVSQFIGLATAVRTPLALRYISF